MDSSYVQWDRSLRQFDQWDTIIFLIEVGIMVEPNRRCYFFVVVPWTIYSFLIPVGKSGLTIDDGCDEGAEKEC